MRTAFGLSSIAIESLAAGALSTFRALFVEFKLRYFMSFGAVDIFGKTNAVCVAFAFPFGFISTFGVVDVVVGFVVVVAAFVVLVVVVEVVEVVVVLRVVVVVTILVVVVVVVVVDVAATALRAFS